MIYSVRPRVPFRFFLCTSVLLMVAPRAAASTVFDERVLAEAFVRGLESGSMAAFRAMASDHDLSMHRWQPVRDLFERANCIEVVTADAHQAAPPADATALIRLTVDGSGTSPLGGARRPIPSIWWLTVKDDLVIAAETEADHAARRFAAAADRDRRAILDAAHAAEGAIAASLYRLPMTLGRDPLGAAAAWLLQRATATGDLRAELYATALLARLRRQAADFDGAVHLMEEWLTARSDCAPPDVMREALVMAADNAQYSHRGRALSLLEQFAQISEGNTDAALLVDAVVLAPTIQIEDFQFNEAMETLRRLEQTARALGSYRGMYWAEHLAGNLYRTLNDDASAAAHFLEAMRLARGAVDLRGYAGASLWYGRQLMGMLPYDEALRWLHQSYDAAPKDDIENRALLLGEIAYHEGVEKGRAAIMAARELLPYVESPWGRRDIWRGIGRVTRNEGRLEEAVAAWNQSLREGRISILWLAWATKTELGNDLETLGRYEEALAHYRESVELTEVRRSLIPTTALGGVRYFRNKAYQYVLVAHLLMKMRREEEALRFLERGRTRVLGEMLDEPVQPPTWTDDEQRQRRALDQRIVALNRAVAGAVDEGTRARVRAELHVARSELEKFDTALALAHPGGAFRSGDGISQSLLLRSQPAPGTAVIEYGFMEERLLIFVVTRDANGAVAVNARAVDVLRPELELLSRRLSSAVARADLGYAADARRLYDLLIRPVEPFLRGQSSLCIIPDWALWLVPFHVLDDGRQPLIAKYTVSYSPSLTLLEIAHRKRTAGPRRHGVAAFGGSEPETVDEVRRIAALYGPESAVYLGEAAAESEAKKNAGRYRILHFATHGVFDDTSPIYSALLMTPSKLPDDDGRLEAREVAELRLEADLAVLSACDTAKGGVYRGEGVVGLAWAFLVAGCPTTVAAQWQVPSRTTAELMVAFHKHYAAGLSPANALRQAQLELLRDPRWSHPFYWAGFVVFGAS